MSERVKQFAVPSLPSVGIPGAFYYIESGDGTDLHEYLADSNGNLRFIGNRSQNSVVSIICGENITSHTPIAIVNNMAYRYDSSDLNHLFCFAGFSKTSALLGEELKVQQNGIISLNSWGLIPNVPYLAGINGNFLSSLEAGSVFKRIIAVSIDSNSLMITQTYTPTIIT